MNPANQLAATLLLIFLWAAGIAGFAAYTIHDVSRRGEQLAGYHLAGVSRAAIASDALTSMQRLAFEMVHADTARRPPLERQFDERAQLLKSSLATLAPLLSADQKPLYDRVSQQAEDYIILSREIRAHLNQGDSLGAEALLTETAAPIFGSADGGLRQLSRQLSVALDRSVHEIKGEAGLSTWILLICTGLLMLPVMGFVLVITPGEIKALKTISGGLKRLAAGDLTTSVEETHSVDPDIRELARSFVVFRQAAIEKAEAEAAAEQQREFAEEQRRRHDEVQAASARVQSEVVEILGGALSKLAAGNLVSRVAASFPAGYEKLRDDFNGAMDQLQEAMGLIKTSAAGIRAGADEISQSAEDLSRRTEQQAASLEESAAALDQITNTIRRTAEASVEASKAVAAVKTDAERSGQVVGHAVSAMSQIEQSSRQIAQIISVIDEIAFQTNLLALNAGVEAARAGEAGRGFAVVASEVRALAQRSAAAAKEIKALISTSSGQVSSGVQLVGETGQALERILSSIAEINGLVAEFAASANEQASGLHEINSAIDQMDHATQQNASMVQESTAASFALASEAQHLSRLIGRFDIGSAAEPVPAPRRRKTAGAPHRATVLRSVSSAAPLPLEADEAEWEEF
jgi:methyl-accepting chemotaxis protein